MALSLGRVADTLFLLPTKCRSIVRDNPVCGEDAALVRVVKGPAFESLSRWSKLALTSNCCRVAFLVELNNHPYGAILFLWDAALNNHEKMRVLHKNVKSAVLQNRQRPEIFIFYEVITGRRFGRFRRGKDQLYICPEKRAYF